MIFFSLFYAFSLEYDGFCFKSRPSYAPACPDNLIEISDMSLFNESEIDNNKSVTLYVIDTIGTECRISLSSIKDRDVFIKGVNNNDTSIIISFDRDNISLDLSSINVISLTSKMNFNFLSLEKVKFIRYSTSMNYQLMAKILFADFESLKTFDVIGTEKGFFDASNEFQGKLNINLLFHENFTSLNYQSIISRNQLLSIKNDDNKLLKTCQYKGNIYNIFSDDNKYTLIGFFKTGHLIAGIQFDSLYFNETQSSVIFNKIILHEDQNSSNNNKKKNKIIFKNNIISQKNERESDKTNSKNHKESSAQSNASILSYVQIVLIEGLQNIFLDATDKAVFSRNFADQIPYFMIDLRTSSELRLPTYTFANEIGTQFSVIAYSKKANVALGNCQAAFQIPKRDTGNATKNEENSMNQNEIKENKYIKGDNKMNAMNGMNGMKKGMSEKMKIYVSKNISDGGKKELADYLKCLSYNRTFETSKKTIENVNENVNENDSHKKLSNNNTRIETMKNLSEIKKSRIESLEKRKQSISSSINEDDLLFHKIEYTFIDENKNKNNLDESKIIENKNKNKNIEENKKSQISDDDSPVLNILLLEYVSYIDTIISEGNFTINVRCIEDPKSKAPSSSKNVSDSSTSSSESKYSIYINSLKIGLFQSSSINLISSLITVNIVESISVNSLFLYSQLKLVGHGTFVLHGLLELDMCHISIEYLVLTSRARILYNFLLTSVPLITVNNVLNKLNVPLEIIFFYKGSQVPSDDDCKQFIERECTVLQIPALKEGEYYVHLDPFCKIDGFSESNSLLKFVFSQTFSTLNFFLVDYPSIINSSICYGKRCDELSFKEYVYICKEEEEIKKWEERVKYFTNSLTLYLTEDIPKDFCFNFSFHREKQQKMENHENKHDKERELNMKKQNKVNEHEKYLQRPITISVISLIKSNFTFTFPEVNKSTSMISEMMFYNTNINIETEESVRVMYCFFDWLFIEGGTDFTSKALEVLNFGNVTNFAVDVDSIKFLKKVEINRSEIMIIVDDENYSKFSFVNETNLMINSVSIKRNDKFVFYVSAPLLIVGKMDDQKKEETYIEKKEKKKMNIFKSMGNDSIFNEIKLFNTNQIKALKMNTGLNNYNFIEKKLMKNSKDTKEINNNYYNFHNDNIHKEEKEKFNIKEGIEEEKIDFFNIQIAMFAAESECELYFLGAWEECIIPAITILGTSFDFLSIESESPNLPVSVNCFNELIVTFGQHNNFTETSFSSFPSVSKSLAYDSSYSSLNINKFSFSKGNNKIKIFSLYPTQFPMSQTLLIAMTEEDTKLNIREMKCISKSTSVIQFHKNQIIIQKVILSELSEYYFFNGIFEGSITMKPGSTGTLSDCQNRDLELINMTFDSGLVPILWIDTKRDPTNLPKKIEVNGERGEKGSYHLIVGSSIRCSETKEIIEQKTSSVTDRNNKTQKVSIECGEEGEILLRIGKGDSDDDDDDDDDGGDKEKKEKEKKKLMMIIVGVSVLLILLIIVFVVIFVLKRKMNKKPTGLEDLSTPLNSQNGSWLKFN